MPIEKRSILKVYVLGIITLGIYFLYWLVKTKNELNELGAQIPTAWLIIIPIANWYWLYKYAEGFAKVTKKESAILWFLLFFFVGIVMPAIVQSELNRIAEESSRVNPQ
jgi:cbb3-type cytochrome oxidase subunit 3